jgi:hypothetical protein
MRVKEETTGATKNKPVVWCEINGNPERPKRWFVQAKSGIFPSEVDPQERISRETPQPVAVGRHPTMPILASQLLRIPWINDRRR